MRIVIRLVLVVLAAIVVVALSGVGYLYYAFPAVPPPVDLTITATPERVERGRYLATSVSGCLVCHSERDWSRYSGPEGPDGLGAGHERFEYGLPGVLYSKNITPAAVGNWTDGELVRAITTGVSRDGTPLFPLMPYPRYGSMSEEDIHAIVAYLRTLRAVEKAVPPRTLTFPMNLITRTIPAPAQLTPAPDPGDKAAYGKYLVNAAVCADCHTPIDDRGEAVAGMVFAGGMTFAHPKLGYRVNSANITPDADSGIGSWTEQQFIDKFKAFETAPNEPLTDAEQRQYTEMPWNDYARMTREDLSAIYAYLRTVTPVINRVTKHPDAPGQ